MLQLQHHWAAPVTLATADGRPSSSTVSRPLLSTATIPSQLWHCHCITISLDGYALLIYLTVPLCLCGHPSQPGVSSWVTCESTLLVTRALAAIVTISRYRRGLCHDITILKKVHDLSPKANNTEYSKQDTKDMIWYDNNGMLSMHRKSDDYQLNQLHDDN